MTDEREGLREQVASIVRDAEEGVDHEDYEGYGHDATFYYAADRILALFTQARYEVTPDKAVYQAAREVAEARMRPIAQEEPVGVQVGSVEVTSDGHRLRRAGCDWDRMDELIPGTYPVYASPVASAPELTLDSPTHLSRRVNELRERGFQRVNDPRVSAPEEERDPMTREEARKWWAKVNRRPFKEEPKP